MKAQANDSAGIEHPRLLDWISRHSVEILVSLVILVLLGEHVRVGWLTGVTEKETLSVLMPLIFVLLGYTAGRRCS